MRLSTPAENLPKISNYIMPERVYSDENVYFSMSCQAYFGVRHDPLLGIEWSP